MTPIGSRLRSRPALAVAMLLGATGIAVAAVVPWWTGTFLDPLTGEVTVTLSGGDVVAELIPVALVIYAAAGASFAVRRRGAQRIVGALTGVLALVTAIRVVLAAGDDPGAQLSAQLVRPAVAVHAADFHVVGILVGLVGAALVVVATVIIAAVGMPTGRRRSSATYQTPAVQRDHAQRQAARARADGTDVLDAADMWQALDAGVDPTADGTGPVDGVGPGPNHPSQPDTMTGQGGSVGQSGRGGQHADVDPPVDQNSQRSASKDEEARG